MSVAFDLIFYIGDKLVAFLKYCSFVLVGESFSLFSILAFGSVSLALVRIFTRALGGSDQGDSDD